MKTWLKNNWNVVLGVVLTIVGLFLLSNVSHAAEQHPPPSTTTEVQNVLPILQDYMSKAEKALTNYAPKVWEATLQLIRIKGIFSLLLSLCWVLVVVLFWTKWVKLWREWVSNNVHYDQGAAFWAPIILSGIVIHIALITRIVGLFGHILAAFHPDLFVLYQLAQKVGLL